MNKYTRSTDGYFHARVWTGDYKDGKKVYKQLVSKKSSRDLENKVSEYCKRRDNKVIVTANPELFGAYARRWFETYKASASLATKNMYSNVIGKHLKDISELQLDEIRESNIRYLLSLQHEHPSTRDKVNITLKQILKAAEHDKLIPRGTVADLFYDIKLPSYKAAEKRPLTVAEKNALAMVDLTPKVKAFVSLLFYTGMRRGEALALTRQDIDFSAHTVTVNKSLAFDKDLSYIKPPKTKNGYRVIPLSPEFESIAQEYIESKGDIIFEKGTGGYYTASSYKWMWGKFQRDLSKVDNQDHRNLTAHIFRHNFCTNLCYEAVDNKTISIKKIAQLMGDTEAVVLQIYNHVIEEREKPLDAIVNSLTLTPKLNQN